MATIDQYNHDLLDFFECPSDYELIFENTTRKIAIYRLNQNIPKDEKAFQGNVGDILIGGGSGEAPALLITRKGLDYFISDDFDEYDNRSELIKSYWTPTFAYKVGNVLRELGWEPTEDLEFWLAEQVVTQLIERKKITGFNML